MSSTTGLRAGNLLNELARQKAIALKAGRRAETQRERAEMWKERALAAEWALEGRHARHYASRNKRKAA